MNIDKPNYPSFFGRTSDDFSYRTEHKDPVHWKAPLRNGGSFLRQIDQFRASKFLGLDGMPISRTDKNYCIEWEKMSMRRRRENVKKKASLNLSMPPIRLPNLRQ